jgi:hypothetical protein
MIGSAMCVGVDEAVVTRLEGLRVVAMVAMAAVAAVAAVGERSERSGCVIGATSMDSLSFIPICCIL